MTENAEPRGHHRIFNDDAQGITATEPDSVAHSAEAMKILHEQGVDAYQRYVAEHTEK